MEVRTGRKGEKGYRKARQIRKRGGWEEQDQRSKMRDEATTGGKDSGRGAKWDRRKID